MSGLYCLNDLAICSACVVSRRSMRDLSTCLRVYRVYTLTITRHPATSNAGLLLFTTVPFNAAPLHVAHRGDIRCKYRSAAYAALVKFVIVLGMADFKILELLNY